ncbi:MAG: flavodoxin [Oscillospiraceae bacterium]
MSKVLVVYWSGTGNTQAMAEAVAEGARGAGAEVEIGEVGSINAAKALEFDHIAFGCPSMGDEVLEESDMEPFFTEVEKGLSGKKIALFGSYDWGDGQWMRDWVERSEKAGAAVLASEGLIVNLTPDADALDQCKKMGADLAAL